jgi:endonuclease III
MKQGTAHAARLKKAYAKVRHAAPTPQIPEPDEPLHRLGIAILGVKYGDVQAQQAIDQLLTTMTDWNDVRVSRPSEINAAMGNANPERLEHCQRLIRALQSVYDHENRLSLDRLRQLGRREARQYLEGLDGVDQYAVASVALWSLGGHGIPIDDRLLRALRDADLVHPDADRGEVQAFLERHVAASEAKEFCIIMRSFGAKVSGATKRPRTATGKKRTTKKKST